jgi:putative ABC transport system permease protein
MVIQMLFLTGKMIRSEKVKFLFTISGTGTVLMLILFLLGVYEGIKLGSTSYIRSSGSDIWVCQKNSTNLLRSSSFLLSSLEHDMRMINGIKEIQGIIRIITTAELNNKPVTLFLFGFNPESKLGKPYVIKGTTDINDSEIIIDQSFSRKYKLSLNDTILVQHKSFVIAGISSKTNATVAQFSFTTISSARNMLGFGNVSSFFLLTSDEYTDNSRTIEEIRTAFPSLAVYGQEQFISNNIDEMENGVLPVIWTISVLGLITGGIIISLMLVSSILERREDYALLKALGMLPGKITMLVLLQSFIISITGFTAAVLLYTALSPMISSLVPELSSELTLQNMILLFSGTLFTGGAASLISIQKLSNIYPAEVFRA